MDKTCAWMWLSLDTFRSFLNMLSQFLLSAFYFPYFVKKYLNYSNNIRIFEPFQRFEYIRTFFKISNNIRIRIRKFSDWRIIFGFGFGQKKRFDHLWNLSFTTKLLTNITQYSDESERILSLNPCWQSCVSRFITNLVFCSHFISKVESFNWV